MVRLSKKVVNIITLGWVSKEGNFEFYESSSAKVIRGIKIDVDLNISLEKYTLSSLQLEDCSFKHLFVEKHGGISNLTIKIDKCSIGNLVLFGTYIQEVCLKNSFLNRMHSHYISAKEVELIDCSGSLDFGAPEGNSELFDVIIKGGDYESISLQNHEKSSITLTGGEVQDTNSHRWAISRKKEKTTFKITHYFRFYY